MCIRDRPQGARRAWLEQAVKNAEMALARALTESGARAARTLAPVSYTHLDVYKRQQDSCFVAHDIHRNGKHTA